MRAGEVIAYLEAKYPAAFASGWDNPGLLAGDRQQEVQHIYIALDATDEVIEAAVNCGADMLVTHHPLVFSAIKKVNGDDFIGRRLLKMIQNGLVYYAMHTNYDVLGMAELSAEILGLQEPEVLEVTWEEKIYKLSVMVPVDEAGRLREALFRAGAGECGNYSHCSFSWEGTGSFQPQEGSDPYIGSTGVTEKVREVSIGTIVPASCLAEVLHTMKEHHPYETVAYDLYPLMQEGRKEGFGRIGSLPESMPLQDYAALVKQKFGLPHVQVYGDPMFMVKRAAISPGSGKSMIVPALSAGADVLVTGDIGHHEGIDAVANGMAIIDAGHYGTEHIFVQDVADYLRQMKTEPMITMAEICHPAWVI